MRADARVVEPIGHPLDATVRIPGSKSLTNRALVCAALAGGRSVLEGVLEADDTDAMLDAIGRLGATVAREDGGLVITGTGGHLTPGPLDLDVRLSGTTSRFVLPLVALGRGRYRIDGGPPLRTRPMGPILDALRSLGVTIEEEGRRGHVPATVLAQGGLAGGVVRVRGDLSSQFLSGLLLMAPCTRDGLRLEVTSELVSRPYVELSLGVMAAFGADATWVGERTIAVSPGGYRAANYRVEADASSASYLLAAAAICGGRVTVEGLGTTTRQGDARFADILAEMGPRVDRTAAATTVVGAGTLKGLGDVDLSDIPDMAQTLAAVAVFADSTTRVTGVGFIRGHETDRIAATVTELRRRGIEAAETGDGFEVHPGIPRAGRVETYDDHRMAMSFALLGLRVPGIEIADPGCVGKTFPGYWETLDRLR